MSEQVSGFRATVVLAVLGFVGCILVGPVIAGTTNSGPIDYLPVFAFDGIFVVGGAIAYGCLYRFLAARRTRRKPVEVAVFVVLLLGLAAMAGWTVLDRGVIPPWAPVATSAASACQGLQAAGLDRVWPAAQRQQGTGPYDNGAGYSACYWQSRLHGVSRYSGIAVTVDRKSSRILSSGLGSAVAAFEKKCGNENRSGQLIGDTACRTDSGSASRIVSRKANVVVTVDVDFADGHTDGGLVAANLAANLVSQIHVA